MAIWYCKRCKKIMGAPRKGVNPRELFHRCFDGKTGGFEIHNDKETTFNQDKWMRYEDDIIAFYMKNVYDWFDSKDRKPANIAFTQGLARNIASAMEYAESKKIRQINR